MGCDKPQYLTTDTIRADHRYYVAQCGSLQAVANRTYLSSFQRGVKVPVRSRRNMSVCSRASEHFCFSLVFGRLPLLDIGIPSGSIRGG
jgi:hypothetical protein